MYDSQYISVLNCLRTFSFVVILRAPVQVYDRSPPKRAAQKLPRDTGNPTMLGKERSFGPYGTGHTELETSDVGLSSASRLDVHCLNYL